MRDLTQRLRVDVRRHWADAALLVLILGSVWRTFVSQAWSDDESIQALSTQMILDSIRSLDPVHLADLLSLQDNPPLRYLLGVPGLVLFPATPHGLRLGAVAATFAMTFALVRLGTEVGGRFTGYAAGVLVAASAVYTWTAFGFGWSVIVLGVVQAIRHVRRATLDLRAAAERTRFWIVHVWLALGFLTNTGAILFVFSALALYAARNVRALRAAAVAAFPVAAFYAVYFVWFFVVAPEVTPSHSSIQRDHFSGRGEISGLNVTSFLENVRGLNAYILPYAGPLFVALGAWYVVRRERRALVIIAPFALAWSFWLRLATQSYFLLAAIVLFPFAVAQLRSLLGERGGAVTVGVLACAFGAWNYAMFIHPYSEEALPRRPLELGWGQTDTRNNVVQPWRAIVRDLNAAVGPDGRYVEDVAGPLSIFYWRRDGHLDFDVRDVARINEGPYRAVAGTRCERLVGTGPPIAAVVTRRRLCSGSFRSVRRYPGSRVAVYVLEQRR